ncbi:MAG: calcium-binding protein, partial [Alphaproteobacteria bacterium]
TDFDPGTGIFELVPDGGVGKHFVAVYRSDGTLGQSIDTTDPDTSIVDGPTGTTADATAAFQFASNELGVVYDLVLDGTTVSGVGAFHTTGMLGDGPHTLLVAARDGAGNVDQTPASRIWTVDTTPPETTIVDGPSGLSDPDVTFDFGADDPDAVFVVVVDGTQTLTVVDSVSGLDLTLTDLAFGFHTVVVAARDQVGNTDATPVTRTWLVDDGPPETTIASGPSGPTASRTAVFDFTSDDGDAVFDVVIDGVTVSGASDPFTLTNLADGAHTLVVAARDPLGFVDPTPAVRQWTVDVDAPPAPAVTAFTTDDGEPGDGVTTDRSLTVSGTAEAGATVHVFRDGVSIGSTVATGGGTWSLADPATQAIGIHRFTARAEDAAGNDSPLSPPFEVLVATAGGGTPGPDALVGNDAAGHHQGVGGNDTVLGYGGNDTLKGNDGNDSLLGGDGADRLEGENGDDVGRGGNGNDSLLGQNGNDSLFGENGNDRLDGGPGADVLEGGIGADTMFGAAGVDTLVDGPGADRIYGEAEGDLVVLTDDGARDTVYGTVAHLSDDTIDGFVGGSPTSPGADALMVLGLSIAKAKKLDGDAVDGSLSLAEVGGGTLWLTGVEGTVDTMYSAGGVLLYVV